MNLKNEALQELYDRLLFGPVLSSPYAESTIERAFKECDEKLSESATFKLIADIQHRCDNLERSNKALRDDNDKLGDKIIELKKKNEQLGKALIEKGTENSTLISANADLSEKVVDHEKRITELQKKGDDLTKKGEDLKKRINSVYGIAMTGWPKDFRKEGMYELWSKLREVVDSTYPERLGCFSDLCDFEDLVEWELEDFLDEYNEWQKKKEKKERDCDRCKMKNPVFYFDNHPVMMGGTLEAKVEVNKDLLATVCGIKPKEEEHELEYGDAVRVPWRDYDYMYIGPEDKHIRLFNPKTHRVIIVSVTENLTYQGCKIILCDEADIRKIWEDKK